MKPKRGWLLAAALLTAVLWAAEAAGGEPAAPRGFRDLELGMALEAVKERLAADALFAFRGDPDVSLLPSPQQTLIECAGVSWVRRAFFQFHEGRLFSIILVLDPRLMDHYTMFQTLSRKYGAPERLDPTEAVWEFPGVRLSLERPLSVKYLDSAVFAALREQGQAAEDLMEITKQMFLELF